MTKSKKILIVEGATLIRDSLASPLENSGHKVLHTSDGKSGYQTATQHFPDLIIAQADISPTEGNHYIKQLCSSLVAKAVPIIVVSGRKNTQDYFESIGVAEFVHDPFNPEDLLARVVRLLKSSRRPVLTESNKRVLIIGNDVDNVEHMAAELRKDGHHTDFVNAAEQAISKAVLFLPNLIILNAEMIDMRSSELVRILRQMPQFKKIPIVVYCAYKTHGIPKDDIRQKELHTGILANSCLDENATEFIGRYDPEIFLEKLERHLSHATVVLIDDDGQVTLQLKVQLERQGFRVYAAPDAETGLELVKEHRPHLILLDLVLPNATGYTALQMLKTNPATKSIPVILISVKNSAKDIDTGLDLGADDFMVKPLHIGLLLKRIRFFVE